MLSAWLVRA